MRIDSSHFKIEKIAWIMPAISAGMTAMGLASSIQDNKVKSRLTPLDQDSNYRLQSPTSYQFEGGKHLPTKPVIGIHTASNF